MERCRDDKFEASLGCADACGRHVQAHNHKLNK